MALPLKKSEEKYIYTYSDYISWPDEELWQIIEGVPYDMSPSPFEEHQRVSGILHIEIGNYLKGKKCRVYAAPFDVILPEKGERENKATNIVQPDILVVCDKEKITRKGCVGAPDFIIEILSRSTANIDANKKRKLYERFGVKEYWLTDPIHEIIWVYRLEEDNKYGNPEVYGKNDKVKVGIFDDLLIDLGVIFEGELL